MTCCKGHDFSVRPCSSPLHSSLCNRTHELDYVLLCPLIISHARSSLYRLRNGSKSQRGAQLLRRTKQEKVEKKGKAGKFAIFVLIPFLLHLWWRYTFRIMGSIEFVKWGRRWTRLVSNLRDNLWGQGWLLRKIEACNLSWANDKIFSSYPWVFSKSPKFKLRAWQIDIFFPFLALHVLTFHPSRNPPSRWFYHASS